MIMKIKNNILHTPKVPKNYSTITDVNKNFHISRKTIHINLIPNARMESLSKSCFLSREEEVELARSNKKVKDVHHTGFSTSQRESQLHQYRNTFSLGNGSSFKDKIVGEIPGDYN